MILAIIMITWAKVSVESLNNKIDDVENRESRMKDKVEKMDYPGKAKDNFLSIWMYREYLKIYVGELWKTMKISNLLEYMHRINRKYQIKSIENIFHKIMEKSLANLEKYMYIQVQETYKTLNRPDENKKETSHNIL